MLLVHIKIGYISKHILIIIFDHSIGLVKKDIRTFKGIMIQTMEKGHVDLVN